MHKVEHAVVKSGESVLYYLVTMPAAGESAFVRKELRLVPIGTIDTEALPQSLSSAGFLFVSSETFCSLNCRNDSYYVPPKGELERGKSH